MGDSVEFCGGTHVHDTAEIGVFKIISESSVAAGVRRIEAATGMGVLELLDNAESVIGAVASEFKAAGQAEVVAKAQSVAKELKAQAREIESLQAQLANGKIKELFENTVTVKGIRYIHAVLKDTASDSLRTLGDQVKADAPDVVAVFAAPTKEKQVYWQFAVLMQSKQALMQVNSSKRSLHSWEEKAAAVLTAQWAV